MMISREEARERGIAAAAEVLVRIIARLDAEGVDIDAERAA